jgi:DnaJ-class molecular chaperone
MPVEFKDYYATLGVSKTATEAEIKKAFRKLARQHHPDLNPGDSAAEAKFKDINEANEVLGDPESRRKYDDLGASWRNGNTAGWEHAASQPRRRSRTVTPDEMSEMFGGGGDFSDFFTTFFGGGGGGARSTRTPRSRPGRDAEQDLSLTLEEAFLGTSRHLSVVRKGRPHTVEVKIPVGVKEGSRIKVRGEGEPGVGDQPAGDLYLVVRLAPHARFERRGQDLHMRLAVPVTTAVLGGDVSVPTLSGSSIKLRVPELTPAGRTFRLRGHGMPELRAPDQRGDLFVLIDIQVPTQLSDQARAHYQALEKLAGTK